MRLYPFIFGIWAATIALAFGFAHTAYAAVIIDSAETGSPGADDEFILLRNTGQGPVDISRWSIQVRSDGSTTIQKKNFTTGAQIDAGSTYTVANKNGRFALQAQMTYTSLSLVDRGTTVALVNTNSYVSTFEDSSVVSLFHSASTTATSTSSAPSSATSTPTPQNGPTQTTTILTSGPDAIAARITHAIQWPIVLSELFPHPTSGDEFIEIENTSMEGVDVAGLWLRDASGAAYALGSHGENTMLGPGSRRMWLRKQTMIALNDSGGEMVQLLDTDGKIIDQVIYSESASINAAYAKIARAWQWTVQPTPNAPNEYISLPAPPTIRATLCGEPLVVNNPCAVSAEDTTDPNNDLAEIIWNFGDGFEISGTTTTHKYDAPGLYTILVRARDSVGSVAELHHDLRVNAAAATTTTPVATQINKPIAQISEKSIITETKQLLVPTNAVVAAAPLHAAVISQPHAYEYIGVVTVPPGIISAHRFIVDSHMVEALGNRPELLDLKAGTRIEFRAAKKFRTDRMLLQISAQGPIKILGTSTVSSTRIMGKVTDTGTSSFLIHTESEDVFVPARGHYSDGTRVKLGDTIAIQGVFLTDEAAQTTFVPQTQSSIILTSANTGGIAIPTKQNSLSSLFLLGATVVTFLLLHILITWSSRRLRSPRQAQAFILRIRAFVTKLFEKIFKRPITH